MGGWTYFTIHVNGIPIPFRADSGANVSTISETTWRQVNSPKLKKFVGSCKQVDGEDVGVKGYFSATFKIRSVEAPELLLVLSSGGPSLLCDRLLKWSTRSDDIIQLSNGWRMPAVVAGFVGNSLVRVRAAG